MERGHDTARIQQRGSSLVEFCFMIPVLLLIAGATIDISRYMRFLQITTFVSQETAGQIYRQCSDITIYNPPVLTTTTLQINTQLTQAAIQACIERVQVTTQQLLNRSVGRAAVSSKVFRWRIGDVTAPTNCALQTSMGTNVTVISAPAILDATQISEPTQTRLKNAAVVDVGSPTPGYSGVTWSPMYVQGTTSTTPASGNSTLTTALKAALTTEGIKMEAAGIYQTKNGSSPGKRLLVSPSSLCQKGRLTTVEVSYAFEPIVKFLPKMMVKLNTDGSQRETTVL